MTDRPRLNKELDSQTFREYYYLKEELTVFCRENGLPVSGGKLELTERIAYYLDTGKVLNTLPGIARRKKCGDHEITKESIIENDLVCSEKHRAFFKKEIGNSFSFNVSFQKWLRENAGNTYAEAVAAYNVILAKKKQSRSSIDKQFEYNAYIRDFFADNAGKSLNDAIRCWNYKKGLKGSKKYERSDLSVLK